MGGVASRRAAVPAPYQTMSERMTEEDAEPTYRRTERNYTERGKWVSGLVALLGLWLIVAALVFTLVPANFWNHIIVGALAIVLGGYNYARRANERFGSVAAAAFVALLGLWLVVSPWILDSEVAGNEVVTETGFWNAVIVGVLLLLLGAYSAYEATDTETRAPAETR